MRIAVLCNDRLGLAALQQLVQNRLVQAVGTSDSSPEMPAIMQQLTMQSGVPSKIFTRTNFEAELSAWLDQHKPDVVLVKTFPFRIPAAALSVPKHGFINFHYAPLPEFRGSNPLFWMIKEQLYNGGVTVHRMNEKFDDGPILLQQAVTLSPEASFGICSTQLAYAGAQLTGQLLHGLQHGTLQAKEQEKTKSRWYGRPKPEDLFINWKNMSAAQVVALVKACNPWLKGAPTRWRGWPVGIADASVSNVTVDPTTTPGTILQLSADQGLIIACNDARVIKAEVIYTEEGFFAGDRLAQFGLKAGDRFD